MTSKLKSLTVIYDRVPFGGWYKSSTAPLEGGTNLPWVSMGRTAVRYRRVLGSPL